MKRIYIYILILTAFSGIMVSCVEEIEIDLDSTYTRLVVEGEITTDTTEHWVKLSTTSDYFENEEPPVVSGATVTISDGNNVYELKEKNPGTGIYYTAPGVYGIPGNTYKLDIKLQQPIGNHAEYSAESKLKPIGTIDSIGVKYYDVFDGWWAILLYATEPGQTTDFYVFKAYLNDINLSDEVLEWNASDDAFFNGNYTYGIDVQYWDNTDLPDTMQTKVGDTVTLEMLSVTEDYINFIWNMQSEMQGSNPMFGGPPANVKGNISNGGIGFFTAHSVVRKKYILDKIK
jgi:hypothetical protein